MTSRDPGILLPQSHKVWPLSLHVWQKVHFMHPQLPPHSVEKCIFCLAFLYNILFSIWLFMNVIWFEWSLHIRFSLYIVFSYRISLICTLLYNITEYILWFSHIYYVQHYCCAYATTTSWLNAKLTLIWLWMQFLGTHTWSLNLCWHI